jgi:hypothetical protein
MILIKIICKYIVLIPSVKIFLYLIIYIFIKYFILLIGENIVESILLKIFLNNLN